MTEAKPRSILVFSGRYHIISNALLVNNCIMSPELFWYVSNFESLRFDSLLSDVHNGIAVEFISKPLQQIVVQTEEQRTNNVSGQTRKIYFF